MKKADYIFSTSNKMKGQVNKLVKKEVIVTPFGVDLNLFRPRRPILLSIKRKMKRNCATRLMLLGQDMLRKLAQILMRRWCTLVQIMFLMVKEKNHLK